MNDNRVSEIKKEDKKQFKKFMGITILSGIIGGIFGFTSDNLKAIIGENLSNFLMNTLEAVVPYISIVLSIIVIIGSYVVYTKSRKGYELWKQKGEDDYTIDKIEEDLSYVLLVTSVNTILGFFFLGTGFKLLMFNNLNNDFNILKVSCLFLGFLTCIVSSTLIQKNIINLEKEINPLLKGSVYDTKFSSKWLDSCDESIKLSIYKSSYKSYTCTSTACAILWVFCIIGLDLWNFGIMPIVIVTIIWLVLTISYCLESIKNSKIK